MDTAISKLTVSQTEACEIAVEAYIYFYPLISMDITRRVMSNVPPGVKEGAGPPNAFHHMSTYPPAELRDVVRPNFDTLYSVAWLDLTGEPMVMSTQDTGGRYFLLPMLDLWSDVFAVPGKRTNGTQAASFAVCPAGWSGSLPDGVERIDSPTSFVWILGRTQTNGPRDYDAVHKVQAGYKVTPLSHWGKTSAPVHYEPDASVDMKTPPLVQVDTMPAATYFSYAAELMKNNPPHLTDWSMVARLKRIGIEPGKSFDWNKAAPGAKAALERAPEEGQKRMKAKLPTLSKVVNGWQISTDLGVYGNDYLKRAIVAQIGLGANQPEDAVYPICLGDSDGQPLRGENRYTMHFAKDELPPVDAFWSITMYDEQGFQVANRLNRFAIGDRDELQFNPDGSLELFIQHESPGGDKEANWLPSPASGVLGVTMRLYAPKASVLEGAWAPPAIRKV